MKINVYVSKENAIITRSEQFGEMEVDVDLSVFSDAELVRLQNATWNGKNICVNAPTAEAIQEKCARLVQEDEVRMIREKKELEKRTQEREERIAKALASPALELFKYNRQSDYYERVAWFASVADDPRLAAVVEAVQARIVEFDERNKKYRHEQQVKKFREEKEKELAAEAWNTEKASWIEAHGSDRLKKAHDEDYPHNGAYAAERGSLELGDGWIIDTKNAYGWDQKVYPSEAALDLEKALKTEGHMAEIVWVTRDRTRQDDEDDAFVPFEALVIRKFLDKYNAIHAM